MPDDILLTGATGYVGRYLLRTWLEKTNRNIRLLARGRTGKPAAWRIEQSLRDVCSDDEFRQWTNRLTIHEGDIAREDLGLSSAEYETMANTISEIIHCAAAARFDLAIEDARRTNVGGVRHLLQFASRCSNLDRLHYVGTAYVAGLRSGRVLENELDVGQEHRNTYERSKFEAETLLRQSMTDFPVTIYRPSIVICDSRTGKASDHNGFYRVLRMYLQRQLPVLPGAPESELDLVPVDYVSGAIYRIANSAQSRGMCYQITAGIDGITTLSEIRRLASQYSGLPPFALLPPGEFKTLMEQSAAVKGEDERKLIEELSLYLPYLFCRLQFDTTNVERETGLRAPRINGYFDRFIAHIMAEIR